MHAPLSVTRSQRTVPTFEMRKPCVCSETSIVLTRNDRVPAFREQVLLNQVKPARKVDL